MKGIIGKEVTPYVLERVNQLSGGSSLKANIALIENNARIGAKIAVQYEGLMARSTNQSVNTLKSSNSLHSVFIDAKITNGSNNSSKSTIQSKSESIHKDLIEHKDNQSEQLSPVRCFNAIIRSIVLLIIISLRNGLAFR